MSDKPEFNPRKFAVIGAGPVGCIVAAFLAKGGYEVTLCDVIPDLLDRPWTAESSSKAPKTFSKKFPGTDEHR